MAKPTFLGVGVMKCGTTTLHDYFRGHPGVFVPQVKESNFLVRPDFSPEMVDSYEEMFPEQWGVRGEICPGYIDASKQIHEMYPRLKIIILVRDPIERMVSHMRHNHTIRGKHIFEDFSSWAGVIENSKRYDDKSHTHDSVRLSMYDKIIPKWTDLFENVLIMKTNSLSVNYEESFMKICRFLDVSPYYPPNSPIVSHISDLSGRPKAPLSDTERDFFLNIFSNTYNYLEAELGIRFDVDQNL